MQRGTTPKTATSDECFEAMVQHGALEKLLRSARLELADRPGEVDRVIISGAMAGPPGAAEPPPASPDHSEPDWLVGATAISAWITENYFECSERKVFRMFEYYGSRPGGPGFFKLCNRVCLSKSRFKQWAATKINGSR